MSHSRQSPAAVWLALHTTGVPGAVAIAKGDTVVSMSLDPQGQYARSLLGAIEQLLQRVECDVAQIEGIVTTCGPGSFTGIRIGLATAQGLAAARGQNVAVCDSLLAEAVARRSRGWLAVVLDARRGEVFAALYHCDEAGVRALVEPFVAAPQAASEQLLQALPTDAALQIIGDGAALLPLPAAVKSQSVFREVAARQDLVQALLGLAQEGRCPTVAPEELKPLYLRKSDAELNRQARLRTS